MRRSPCIQKKEGTRTKPIDYIRAPISGLFCYLLPPRGQRRKFK
nr:MAG TPA: hypothetical protein [Caudoviricetes sp.]